MGTTVDTLEQDYRGSPSDAAARSLGARQARAHRRRGQGVPPRPGEQRHRGPRAGAAAATRRCSRPRARCSETCGSSTPARSCCSTPSAPRSRTLFNVLRTRQIGFEAELHKRTLECGLLSLIGPDARARWPAPETCRPPRHAHVARRRSQAARSAVIATDLGVDVDLRRRGHRARCRGARASRRAARRRGRRRGRARRVRAPALRRRPRRLGDPPGGRAERARRQLHEGLLRRAGDRRAPVLPGQAQPASARAAA